MATNNSELPKKVSFLADCYQNGKKVNVEEFYFYSYKDCNDWLDFNMEHTKENKNLGVISENEIEFIYCDRTYRFDLDY